MMMSEPEPTDVMPTTSPPSAPTMTVGDGPYDDHGRARAVGPHHPVADPGPLEQPQVGADDQPERGDQQGHAERLLQEALQRLAVGECARDQHAAEGRRHRAQAQPPHEPEVHRLPSQVHGGPGRLHHRTRDQVAGDGDERVHLEEEDEGRRHQRTAAHAGQADDDADEERGDQKEQVHRRQPCPSAAGSHPRDCMKSTSRPTASSTESTDVSMVTSASVGSSYGSLMPVKCSMSPARARA